MRMVWPLSASSDAIAASLEFPAVAALVVTAVFGNRGALGTSLFGGSLVRLLDVGVVATLPMWQAALPHEAPGGVRR